MYIYHTVHCSTCTYTIQYSTVQLAQLLNIAQYTVVHVHVHIHVPYSTVLYNPSASSTTQYSTLHVHVHIPYSTVLYS